MESNRYTIYNKSREASIGSGVTMINSTREPLTALRVMVEGLGSGQETGLWLTQVTVIPMVPRISPFDLVYLDREHRVVERVELLPATEIPRFKKPASSALVLPFRTISSTKIEVGHEFRFEEIDESEAAASAEPEPPAAPLQVVKPQPAASLAVLPVAQIAAQADAPLLNPFLAMTAEPKAVEVPVKVEARTPIKTNKEFDLADFLRSNSGSAAASAEVAFPVVQEQPLLTMPAPKRKARKAPAPVERPMPQPIQNPEELPASPQGKKAMGNRFFRWLYPALYDQNRRITERRSSQGLVAFDFVDDVPRMHEVANISSRGLYLNTQERWEQGTVVSLTLQAGGPYDSDSQQRIEFDCAAVRTGEDGVGMAFVLPEGIELNLWEAPGRNGADETDPHCILRELRMARALAFMRRICPPADEKITELLHKTLSNVRAANTVEIALKAERLQAQEPDAYCMVAHRDLILRILEHGSWVDVEWLQELWAGLLATSCTLEGQDESNLVYVNLLSRLAPLPTQILTMACAKAMQAMTESVPASPARLACSAEEIARITRSNNMLKIYKSIGELSELGLMEKNPRSISPEDPGAAKAMPTQLGLAMFARCNGQRDAPMAA
ncbi:MAG TPA: hypothetical protein VHW46_10365 [Terracidiphilus sp.]|jgi:hypothetical protein|nr:hypothetical protein [Terracidiphilus sp.]